jgi:murein DD-endopeptidase MepM/ murein hydrolase activator NlpD
LSSKNQKGAYGKSMGGYGNHVVILSEEFFRKVEGDTSLARHKQVYATLYGHMKSFGAYDPVENPIEYNGLIERFYNSKQVSFRDVKIVGVRTVTVGEVIGVMGSTGRSTGEHLHYEVRAMRDPLGKVEYMNPEAFQVKVPQYDYVYGTPHLGMGGGE